MADLIEQAFGESLDLLNDGGVTPTESVTFTPTGGSARTITATVIRQPVDRLFRSQTVDIHTPLMDVYVQNDGTAGMTVAEAQAGGTITVAYRYGGTALAFNFTIIDTTASEIRLRLR